MELSIKLEIKLTQINFMAWSCKQILKCPLFCFFFPSSNRRQPVSSCTLVKLCWNWTSHQRSWCCCCCCCPVLGLSEATLLNLDSETFTLEFCVWRINKKIRFASWISGCFWNLNFQFLAALGDAFSCCLPCSVTSLSGKQDQFYNTCCSSGLVLTWF